MVFLRKIVEEFVCGAFFKMSLRHFHVVVDLVSDVLVHFFTAGNTGYFNCCRLNIPVAMFKGAINDPPESVRQSLGTLGIAQMFFCTGDVEIKPSKRRYL